MPYVTPATTPVRNICWRISVPDDERMLAALLGQLLELTELENWESIGGLTEQESVDIWQPIFKQFSVGRYCMIGSLVHFATTNPPPDILECDGTSYLRVDYPDLYDRLLPSYIIDPDNFNVPDLRDKFLLGAGTGHAVEDTGGEETHVLTVTELAVHDHSYIHVTAGLDFFTAGPPDPTGIGSPFPPLTTGSSGGDTPHENMPPFVAFKIGIVAL